MGGFRRAMTWALLLGGSALCSPAVQAKGFYFGGSVGLSEARDLDFAPIADGSTLSGRTDGTDSGWKLYGGFKVMRFLNAELSYRDHGQAAFTAISDGTGTIYAMGPVEGLSDTTAFSVSAMVVLPAGRFTLFAKGGLARWRTETTVTHSMGNVAGIESDGVDALYGAGIAWRMKGSTGLRLEYERFGTNAADQDLLSAGVHFKF